MFLVRAGRGVLGVAVLGLAACSADDEARDAGGEPATDPRYSLGLPTADLLARANLTAPTGVDHGSDGNGYWEASPSASKTWDMRDFTASGHFDCDATSPDTYPTGRYNSPSAPTNHQKNSRPIRLGYTTPATAPAIIGAKVTGDQSTTLGWTDLKHGSYIQGLIDDGMDPDLAYDEIIGNANMDGDPRVYFASGSWAVVDGIRCHNTWDGFGVYGDGTRTATGTIYIRNSWFWKNRDDGIENDEQRQLHLFDCLFEDAHSLLSTRANDETGSPAGRQHPDRRELRREVDLRAGRAQAALGRVDLRLHLQDADQLAVPGDAEHDHLDGRGLQLRGRPDAAGAVGGPLRERDHLLAGHRGLPGQHPGRRHRPHRRHRPDADRRRPRAVEGAARRHRLRHRRHDADAGAVRLLVVPPRGSTSPRRSPPTSPRSD